MKFLSLVICLLMCSTVMADENDAAKLIKGYNSAVASTIHEGYPYNSVMPYALDNKGFPIVLLSELAVHTENIQENPKASFIVSKDSPDDAFSGSRLTLMGEFVVVPDEEREAAKKAYVAVHKDAAQWADWGDFNFYKLNIKMIYFVGGFGDRATIGWLDVDDYIKVFEKDKK